MVLPQGANMAEFAAPRNGMPPAVGHDGKRPQRAFGSPGEWRLAVLVLKLCSSRPGKGDAASGEDHHD